LSGHSAGVDENGPEEEGAIGTECRELWVRGNVEAVTRARSVGRYGRYEQIVAPGVFTRVLDEPFDPGALTPDVWNDLGTREASDYGEAIYLAIYDGPAGELCGSFLYEHARDGQIVRALVFAPEYPDERLRWRRVEGEPEAWEASFFSVKDHIDHALGRWQNWQDGEPSAPELEHARERCLRFRQGEDVPWFSEYDLDAAIRHSVIERHA
jgi:hypothetical protein